MPQYLSAPQGSPLSPAPSTPIVVTRGSLWAWTHSSGSPFCRCRSLQPVPAPPPPPSALFSSRRPRARVRTRTNEQGFEQLPLDLNMQNWGNIMSYYVYLCYKRHDPDSVA